MDIKVEDGTHYFWPQGDNMFGPDGCWVPFDHVYGFIVELHKDSHPKNVVLRQHVLDARAEMDQAWDDYAARYLQDCGFAPEEGKECLLSQSEIDAHDLLWFAYVEAWDMWECWQASAITAYYDKSGQTAPIFSFCWSSSTST